MSGRRRMWWLHGVGAVGRRLLRVVVVARLRSRRWLRRSRLAPLGRRYEDQGASSNDVSKGLTCIRVRMRWWRRRWRRQRVVVMMMSEMVRRWGRLTRIRARRHVVGGVSARRRAVVRRLRRLMGRVRRVDRWHGRVVLRRWRLRHHVRRADLRLVQGRLRRAHRRRRWWLRLPDQRGVDAVRGGRQGRVGHHRVPVVQRRGVAHAATTRTGHGAGIAHTVSWRWRRDRHRLLLVRRRRVRARVRGRHGDPPGYDSFKRRRLQEGFIFG